jgi:hypothetical protein
MSSTSGALPQPRRGRPGPWPPAPPPQPQAQPLSWAKRTGFQSRVSGESLPSSSAHNSGQAPLPRPAETPSDLESGPPARPSSTLPAPPAAAGNGERQHPPPPPPQARTRRRDSDSGRPNGQTAAPSLPQLQEEEEAPERPAHVKYELRDTPGICEYPTEEEKCARAMCAMSNDGRCIDLIGFKLRCSSSGGIRIPALYFHGRFNHPDSSRDGPCYGWLGCEFSN